MNKSGIGLGSASVVLVFTTLCLTIFALISYTAAGNSKALTDVEARMVINYYEADTLAECILAELITADTIPDTSTIRGTEVKTQWDGELAAGTAEFSCIVSGSRELYVKVAFNKDSYDILSWRMRDTGTWLPNDNLQVWPGK
ncbi:MAG: hypothetical protein FWE49_02545 [Synergistaceae bacterium]|nr:hypothetical protein [Synergistaceae bacterium]